jgi:two-component system, OmpR family, response regulator
LIDAEEREAGGQERGKPRFRSGLPPTVWPATARKVGDMRILVVEDERMLAGFIEQSLHAEGYAVTACPDGPSGEAAALTGDYALVLLDLTLPGKDGLEVLAAIRERMPELPVIALTARAAVEQRVEGLDRGANDYVTKPFSFEELLARVRAQLRSPSQRQSSVLEVAGIRMDLRTRRVVREGEEVPLTAREFEVLAYLMRHPDQVLSREQILNAVWGYDFDPGTKVLEVYIGYLRRKLGVEDASDPIETVRNVGYRLRVPHG